MYDFSAGAQMVVMPDRWLQRGEAGAARRRLGSALHRIFYITRVAVAATLGELILSLGERRLA